MLIISAKLMLHSLSLPNVFPPSLAVYKKQKPEVLNMPSLFQRDWGGWMGWQEGRWRRRKRSKLLKVSELAGIFQCVGGRGISWHRGNVSVKLAAQDLGSVLTHQISELEKAPAFLAKTSHPLCYRQSCKDQSLSAQRSGGLRRQRSLWILLKQSRMTSL